MNNIIFSDVRKIGIGEENMKDKIAENINILIREATPLYSS